MKAVRIALLGAAIVAGSSSIAAAQAPAPQQQGQGQGAPGARRGNPAMNGIELTDDQKAKIADIQKKYMPEMMAIREAIQNGGDRAEGMKKSMELRDKQSAEIRAILTADQQATFDKNVAEQKAAMEARQRQAPPTI